MQIDILDNTNKIERMTLLIEELAGRLEDAGTVKARTKADYDREIAIATLKLRNGLIKEIPDEHGELIKVENLPVTLIPLIAKGICYEQCFSMEDADAGYKSIVTMLDARKAQLNGYQSINKVLQ